MSRAGTPARVAGFTLLELLVVLVILGIAASGVSLALRDSDSTLLDQEAARLVTLLEAARAESRATGNALHWVATDRGGHTFTPGLTPEAARVDHTWLHPGTRAQVLAPAKTQHLTLGPEPLIPPQRLRLSRGASDVEIATDGLRPFSVMPVPPAPHPPP
jgi:general secretion pathway protein H